MKTTLAKRILCIVISIMFVCTSLSFYAFATEKESITSYTAGDVLTQNDIAISPVKPASTFRNDMVLQRNQIVPVWGFAEKGKKVTVKFNSQEKSVVADSTTGKFSVDLEPMEAVKSGIDMLFICEGKTMKLTNILVGEVWFAAGQSNMAFIIDYLSGSLKTDIINDCEYPNIRIFTQNEIMSETEQEDAKGGKWSPSSKVTVGKFSTLAFLLARGLHKELDVPVGILTAAYGGTRIESHIKPEVLRESGIPVCGEISDNCVYNAMQNPLKGFAVKGAIWYQGEGNVNPGEYVQYYDDYMGLLTNQLRTNFGNPELPLIQVQLPSFDDPTTDYTELRFVQMSCDEKIKGVYTISTYDTGKADDIHPADKGPIGDRAISMALEKAYGKTDKDNNYPEMESYEINGGTVKIKFKNVGSGLKVDQEEVNGFKICSTNGKYLQAKVTVIDKNTISVTADGIKGEVAGFKYACQNYMKPTHFWNNSGNPVRPFRYENLAEVEKPTIELKLDNEYKDFMNFNGYLKNFKYTYNSNYSSWITPEMGAHIPGPINKKGYRYTKSLPIVLQKDNEKTELIFGSNRFNKDGQDFTRANEMWVWVDTTDVVFKELWFGLRAGGIYGTHYSTNELDGRNDLVVYIQSEDGKTWKEQPLNNNGCLENFGNYKGYIRIPTDYIVGQDANDTKVNLTKADAFVIGMITDAKDKDKTIQIDNILFTSPAITDNTGTIKDLVDDMNEPLCILGDVDENGKITTLDVLAILKHLAKIETLDGIKFVAADYNEDTIISTIDALNILKKLANITE